jgi:hypothetical protein
VFKAIADMADRESAAPTEAQKWLKRPTVKKADQAGFVKWTSEAAEKPHKKRHNSQIDAQSSSDGRGENNEPWRERPSMKVDSAAQWRAELSSTARIKTPMALRGLSKFSSESDPPYHHSVFLSPSNLGGSRGKWLFE